MFQVYGLRLNVMYILSFATFVHSAVFDRSDNIQFGVCVKQWAIIDGVPKN
jgi:hypothetical protein